MQVYTLLLEIALINLAVYLFTSKRPKDVIPTVRWWPSTFPEFLDRLTYKAAAPRLIREGYQKHKRRPFRLLKMDMDLIVIPFKYAAELRAIPSDKLDPLTASFNDNAGAHTGILLGSELHTVAIQKRLTPGLARLIPVVLDELATTWSKLVPGGDGAWVAVQPYDFILNLTSRAAARVFVGESLSRNEEFLQAVAGFSIDTFQTIDLLRALGPALGSVVGAWIPSVRRSRARLAYVQGLVGDEVVRRRRRRQSRNPAPEEEPPDDDFLQWCMDLARGEEEARPEALAQRTLGILGMAVVHTTAMATTHMLLDLTADSELRESLAVELQGLCPSGWAGVDQSTLQQMTQLDSFARECQRHNPVGEFTFRRVVRQPITLSDGYRLQPGQQIALASRNINMDPDIIGDAESFYPSRWAHHKQGTASFSHSSLTNLHFGVGRFLFHLYYMIKSIMSRIILEYDFKLASGKETRPSNILDGDKIFPDRKETMVEWELHGQYDHRHVLLLLSAQFLQQKPQSQKEPARRFSHFINLSKPGITQEVSPNEMSIHRQRVHRDTKETVLERKCGAGPVFE
ncbi:cytochrome P450 monooxygenase SirB-like protein [Apiospora saccharicola]|uniref:Cytochrome P450 monooxygenase SirB-like protein n=1 Tax=Apiospora saccharicola TaxID=335842 RepID=A0ABR1TMZ1_9PEZI